MVIKLTLCENSGWLIIISIYLLINMTLFRGVVILYHHKYTYLDIILYDVHIVIVIL